MVRRIFTPAEANQRLPLVKKIVGEILQNGRAMRELLNRTSGREQSDEILELQENIERLMAELEELGCYYKDWNFEIGLVDFPAMLDGEAVLLCWRSDEEKLSWFHGMEDGYAGRQPIPPGLPGDRT